MKLLSVLIDYIDNNREIYSAIITYNKNGFLIDILIDVIEKDALVRLKNINDIKETNLPLDVIVKFYAGGIINIGISWLTGTENYTKEELLNYMDKLIPDKL